jgi:hypothetical protein
MATLVENIPRGPVARERSGSMDFTDRYKEKMRDWREAIREEATQTLESYHEYSELATYIRYLLGEQWPKAPERPKYRSRFVDNRHLQARIDTLSLLTDIRPTIDVFSKVKEYKEQADVIKNCILHEWSRLNMDIALVRVVDHALFSHGFWKVGALPPGQMIITPLGMDCVVPLYCDTDIQESAAVQYKTQKALSYFRAIWGDKANGLEKEASSLCTVESNQYNRPSNIPSVTWNALAPHMRRHIGMNVKTPSRLPITSPLPVIDLEEYYVDDPEVNTSHGEVIVKDPDKSQDEHNYWYRVGRYERLFPRKRLVVFGGDRPMYDGPSVYWHGLYPFGQLVLDPIVWGPGGISKYRALKPVQDAINEIGAGTMDTIKKCLNQTVIGKQGSVVSKAWDRFYPDLPGQKLQTTPVSGPNDIRYIDPPHLPAYVFQALIQYLLPAFDRHAGSLDPTSLGRKKQVPGGDAIEGLRDAMQAPFRLETRYVEAFLRDVGTQAVSNVIQFFTGKQRMRWFGKDGITAQDFDFDPNNLKPWSSPPHDHWKLFPFNVAQGSLHGASKERDKLLAFTLYRAGAISRRELLRRLEIGDIERIERELKEERSDPGLSPSGGGRTPRMSRGQRTGKPA